MKWVKFSGASWTHDNAGFYYSRYAEPVGDKPAKEALYHQKLYYHRLGARQQDDVLIYERPDQKKWGLSGEVSEDGRYLVITVWQGTDPNNGVFVKNLEAPGARIVEVLNEFDARYDFVGGDGTLFWFRTDLDASRGRLIGIELKCFHADRLEAEGYRAVPSITLPGLAAGKGGAGAGFHV